MKNNSIRTVAVIPAYNEEGTIAKVILQARRHADRVVVCDDGSTDMTSTIAKELGASVVRHPDNRGKGEAMRTLFKEVVALDPDVIVTLDGDGQHDPDDIPMLVKAIEAGESDVVVGSRYVDGAEISAPRYRRFGLRVINYLYRRVGGVRAKDTQSGFRAYSQKAFRFLTQCEANGYGIEGEQLSLAAKNGLKVTEIPISVNYKGPATTSKRSPLVHGADLMWTLLRMVVEERPLLYLGLPGIAFVGTGMALGLTLLWTFNLTRDFSMLLATLTLGTFVVGLLLIIAAITLHGLKRLSEKMNRFGPY